MKRSILYALIISGGLLLGFQPAMAQPRWEQKQQVNYHRNDQHGSKVKYVYKTRYPARPYVTRVNVRNYVYPPNVYRAYVYPAPVAYGYVPVPKPCCGPTYFSLETLIPLDDILLGISIQSR